MFHRYVAAPITYYTWAFKEERGQTNRLEKGIISSLIIIIIYISNFLFSASLQLLCLLTSVTELTEWIRSTGKQLLIHYINYGGWLYFLKCIIML
jgi:hypothetical protein